MISALFILSGKGDVLVARQYKNDVRRNVHDVFRIHVVNNPQRGAAAADRSPVLTLGSTSFLSIRSGPLWLVAVARSNQDSSVIFEFLHDADALFRRLFARGDALTESDITNNFVAVYEILAEALDFGVPASLDLSHLRSVVPALAGLKLKDPPKPPPAHSAVDVAYDPQSVPWRSPGLKYRKNEIFVDVGEKINILLDGRGNCVRSFIDGAVSVRACLSGMPVCRLGLADAADDRVPLDTFKFHKCVDMARYDADNCLRFVPPDGAFQLMTYRVENTFPLPFAIVPQLSVHGSIVTLAVRLASKYSPKGAATDVVLKVDVPQRVAKHKVSCSNGSAKLDVESNAILWKFARFYGDSEQLLAVDFELPEAASTFFKPKISLDFAMDSYSASGLQVKYLKVMEKASYKTVKWINYCTRADSYEVRL